MNNLFLWNTFLTKRADKSWFSINFHSKWVGALAISKVTNDFSLSLWTCRFSSFWVYSSSYFFEMCEQIYICVSNLHPNIKVFHAPQQYSGGHWYSTQKQLLWQWVLPVDIQVYSARPLVTDIWVFWSFVCIIPSSASVIFVESLVE